MKNETVDVFFFKGFVWSLTFDSPVPKNLKKIQKSNYELHKIVHCIYTFTNNAPFCRTFQEQFLVIHTMAYTVDCFDYELIAMWHSQFAVMCLVMGQTTDYDSNPIIS